jgi:hypothetical protein
VPGTSEAVSVWYPDDLDDDILSRALQAITHLISLLPQTSDLHLNWFTQLFRDLTAEYPVPVLLLALAGIAVLIFYSVAKPDTNPGVGFCTFNWMIRGAVLDFLRKRKQNSGRGY